MDSKLNIAIVEDNDDLRSLLEQNLLAAGHYVSGASSSEQLDELFVNNLFDVLVVDVNLPGENGFSIAARYRRLNAQLNIVMLTARTAVEDRVSGYGAGADLYLAKPVSNSELLAAIGSISRRILSQKNAPKAILNLRNMTLSASNTVDLNKQEVLVIKALCESPASNLPYFRLLEICGEPLNESSKAALEVRITRLRKKFLEAGILGKSFKALRGDGYQLLVDVQVVL